VTENVVVEAVPLMSKVNGPQLLAAAPQEPPESWIESAKAPVVAIKATATSANLVSFLTIKNLPYCVLFSLFVPELSV
jgi:hypothetical protein